MRHKKRGRKLNRNGAHRKALKRNLAISLFEHESIRTTPQKAKFVKSFVEKLITLAKKVPMVPDMDQKTKAMVLHNRRRAISMLYDVLVSDPDHEGYKKSIVSKLFDNIAPRYYNRHGGYTRIIRLPKNRLGDNAEQCILELVEGEEVDLSTLKIKKGYQHKAKRKEQKKGKEKAVEESKSTEETAEGAEGAEGAKGAEGAEGAKGAEGAGKETSEEKTEEAGDETKGKDSKEK